MKILFSLTYYSPYISGLTLFVKEIAEEAAKNGGDISVLCFKHQHVLADREILNRVKIVRVRPWLKIYKGFISGEWITKSWSLIKDMDILVINLPQAEGLITALMAKLLGKKIIAIYICQIDTPNKLLNLFLNKVSGSILYLADKVVTLTKDYADHSGILTGYKNKMSYIYPLIKRPGVNREWEKSARKRLGKDRIIIGAAARLAAEKGLQYFLETVPILKSYFKRKFTLVIAGPLNPAGEERYKKVIWKIVKKYQENIILLGTVPDDGMGSYYGLLDLLVLPSINSTEAFGVVQVEAMLYGVPVVASDLPGVRIPILKTGMGKLVPIKSSQELAEAMVEILNNKDGYIKQRNIIENEFNYNKTRDQWNKLFFGSNN